VVLIAHLESRVAGWTATDLASLALLALSSQLVWPRKHGVEHSR